MTEIRLDCPKCASNVCPDIIQFSMNMGKNVILFRCPNCEKDVEYKL